MIGKLKGTIEEKQAPDLLLDVGGVGYEIQLPMTSFYQLPEVGGQVEIYTHFVVREDAQSLYGFVARQDRQLFRELLKANGVGPKLALAILSGLTADQFVTLVQNGEANSLTKLPGIGKKTAERLIIELKDRLKNWSAPLLTPFTDAVPVDMVTESPLISVADPTEDAVSALMALGYKQTQAQQAVKKVGQDGLSSEELIKLALKSML
ncbi:Holliday junction branch migration protein RuvA [Algicola sagamiensis]|uniref:Holliday junction branch migration protein RuvA n=1 Tax=Algicola sagamiensis TaxID=163869 RepID=UPI0003772725|nr:Holliday junction branch migration protein RuvA [Algicola sagamiensis]